MDLKKPIFVEPKRRKMESNIQSSLRFESFPYVFEEYQLCVANVIFILNYDILYICRNLMNNPLNCDCHMKWFSEWLQRKSIVTGNPVCKSPASVQDSVVSRVALDQFVCDGEPRNTSYNTLNR